MVYDCSRAKEYGIRGFVALHKLRIQDINARARVQFCQYQGITQQQLEKWLFVDESRVNCFSDDIERIWVKRRRGQSSSIMR